MGRGLHAAATAALVLVAGWLALTRGPGEAAPVPNVTIVLEDSLPGAFEPRVAADGTLAYGTGGGQVVVKRPGDLAFSVLPGPLSAFGFDLSPDGNWLAYGGPDGLYKVQLDGAANTRLWGGAGFASMPAWGDDGFIYFLTGTGEPEDLTRVPQAGGEPELLLQLPGLSLDPQPLPGGRGVAVMVSNASGLEARIVVVDVETGDTVSIAPAGYSPRWSPTGHILYAQATGSIWAVPFDPEKLEVTGAAAPVLDGVLTAALRSAFDVSTSGALVYLSGGGNAALGAFQFALATRDGRFEELPIEPSDHQDARISPDGTKLAYTKRGDIWVFDLDRGTNVALSEGGTGPHNPAWSPDGLHIAYDNGTTIMRRPVDRSVEPSEVGGTDLEDYPQEWLDDGTLIFSTTGNGDLYRIPAEGGAPEPLLTADWEERVPSISPDGRWIAYSSARSGRAAVYVRSWPELLNETPVSTSDQALDFLSQVGWAPDGSAIYYQVGGRIHVARVRTERGFEVVSDEPLDFAFPGLLMDIHPDGRFVVALTGEVDSADSTPPQLVLGTNWAPQVRRAFIGN